MTEAGSPTPTPSGSEAGKGFAAFGWIVFGVAFFLRLMHVAVLHRLPIGDILTGDAAVYHAWAQGLAGGDWIGDAVFYQAPLYPYFLGTIYAWFGEGTTGVRMFQALLGAGSCVLLGATAHRLFTRRAGLIAGLLLAVYPPAIFFDALIQKTALASFLLCLGLRALAELMLAPRRGPALLLGVVLGLLVLVRENALLVVVVLWLWLLLRWRRRALLPAALLLVGLAASLAPVALRNLSVGGELHLTTSQFGPNFYIGNNEGADGTYIPLRFGRGNALVEQQDAVDLAEEAEGRALTPGEVSSYWTDRALGFITEQPLAWLRLLGRKLALTVNRVELIDAEDLHTYAEWSFVLGATLPVFHFGVLAPVAMLGLLLTWRRRRELGALYALLITYTASLVLFFVFARYRYPLVPPLMIFAAAGLDGLAATRATARIPRVAGVLLLMGAVAVASNWSLIDVEGQQATTHYNLGVELAARGSLDDAILEYRAALELEPMYPQAHNNLGAVLMKRGKSRGAIKALLEAVRLKPDFDRAWVNLGAAHASLGELDQAVGAYRQALTVNPLLVEARYNLGTLWMENGKPRRASAEFQRALEVDAEFVEAAIALGGVSESLGDFDAARAAYERVLQLRPGDPEALVALARLEAAAAAGG